MAKLKNFATNHPAYFSLLTVLAFFLIGGLFVFLATLISGAPYSDPLVQSFGSLAAIFVLLIVAWRLLWLRPMGLAYLGKWPAWLITVALLIYIIFGYWLVFLGRSVSISACFPTMRRPKPSFGGSWWWALPRRCYSGASSSTP